MISSFFLVSKPQPANVSIPVSVRDKEDMVHGTSHGSARHRGPPVTGVGTEKQKEC